MLKALDLFCGEGGASMGLHNAGFIVTGVDIADRPRYPFKFIKGDALTVDLNGYDLIWASPPCQAYSKTQKIRGRKHPDLIAPIRERLKKTKQVYIIENVPGAPLKNPVMLCGEMFGIQTYRHRWFESNRKLKAPRECYHWAKNTKMGRAIKSNEFMHIVGNFSGVDRAREIMQMPWASRDGLREAIPPVFAEYLAVGILKG